MKGNSGPGYCVKDACNGCGTSHITFHIIHMIPCLDIQPAGIIYDTFADKNKRITVKNFLGFPLKDTEYRRIDASFIDSQQSTHFQGFDLSLIQNFNLKSCHIADFPDLFSQCLGIEMVNGFIYQITDNVNRISQINQPFEVSIIRSVEQEELRRVILFFTLFFPGFIFVKRIKTQEQSLGKSFKNPIESLIRSNNQFGVII